MPGDPQVDPPWLESLCRIPLSSRRSSLSIHDLFERAGPDLGNPRFVALVRAQLSKDPALVRAWQEYSYDKRGSPSPYMDGTEVGFFEVDDGRTRSVDVRHYDNPVDACADFVFREAVWVLEKRRAMPAGASDA
jgi:hypothetical protein